MSTAKNPADIANVILDCFMGTGDEVLESWVKLQLCVTCETNETGVDDMIDNLLDAGYLRSTVVGGGDHFSAALVLTLEGGRMMGEFLCARREAHRAMIAWTPVA